MLSQLDNFVKKNESDIVLVAGIILIALISFGAGRLSVFVKKEPIVIQDPLPTASIKQAAEDIRQNTEQGNTGGKFVASVKSDKYHWPWCPSAKRIKPENQIWFQSEAEAQRAGYKRDSRFEELMPKDYKD